MNCFVMPFEMITQALQVQTTLVASMAVHQPFQAWLNLQFIRPVADWRKILTAVFAK